MSGVTSSGSFSGSGTRDRACKPRSCLTISFVAGLLTILVGLPASAQSVLYVDANAAGPVRDRTCWCRAYLNLQDALADAEASAGTVTEIRVADGVYRPDQGATVTPGDREATFPLINGVVLRGGYAGCGAPDPEERDIARYETILSGDLEGDDSGDLSDPSRAENAYHVVTAYSVDRSAVLDGFTITAGSATGYDRGGGMLLGGSPTILNSRFVSNSAGTFGSDIGESADPVARCSRGGGAVQILGGAPRFVNCLFQHNMTTQQGGAVYNAFGDPVLSDCRFAGNTSTSGAGGMGSWAGNPILTRCTFTENVGAGGGAFSTSWFGTPILTDCVFTNNRGGWGGAVWVGILGDISLHNCLFMTNEATERGGAFYVTEGAASALACTFADNGAAEAGAAFIQDGLLTLSDSIVWGNHADPGSDGTPLLAEESTLTVTHSCVQGWDVKRNGQGNIDDDPLFVAGPAGCYYLSQRAATQGADSPCVDAGSDAAVSFALDTATTRVDEVVDMGIVDLGYHYPITGTPMSMGNFDRIGLVNLLDLAGWDSCGTGPESQVGSPCCQVFDFNFDEDVDLEDFASFQRVFTSAQCEADAHCDDGGFCNGEEICDTRHYICQPGSAPCAPHEGCHEVRNECFPDRDSDGIPDDLDNCPDIWNPDQTDTDEDGLGDACDVCPGDPANDADNDGVCAGSGFDSPKYGDNDNCPNQLNPSQVDTDNDGLGDVCDMCPGDAANDADNDGVCAGSGFNPPALGDNDNCPNQFNPSQVDTDNDGLADACDVCPSDSDDDTDGDGICVGWGFNPPALGDNDNCPAEYNPDQANYDEDEFGDECDNCPNDTNPDQADGDGDGPGDACDSCPDDPANDADSDGYCTGTGFNFPKAGDNDNCPGAANSSQSDRDDDGLGDACDVCPLDPENDLDSDDVCGDIDECPGTVPGGPVDDVGCPRTLPTAWSSTQPMLRMAGYTAPELYQLAGDTGRLTTATLTIDTDALQSVYPYGEAVILQSVVSLGQPTMLWRLEGQVGPYAQIVTHTLTIDEFTLAIDGRTATWTFDYRLLETDALMQSTESFRYVGTQTGETTCDAECIEWLSVEGFLEYCDTEGSCYETDLSASITLGAWGAD